MPGSNNIKKPKATSHNPATPNFWWERLSQLTAPQHGHKNIYKDPEGLQLRDKYKNTPGKAPWRF